MTNGARIRSALESISHGEFMLTAASGRRSNGVLVDFVGQCANDPPMLVIATAKGQVLTPLIRDSRCFVVSVITDATRPLARRFSRSNVETEDPFIGLPTETTPRGIPILARTSSWFECELVRHFDIDADCELYVGTVENVHVTTQMEREYEQLIPDTHPISTAPNCKPQPHMRNKKMARSRSVLAESS
ncbi:MAG: flavin reductase family protein [Phycisphaerales bacterium]|nr:flavin reductase family protein [Phycisphaerales bacterium]